MDNEVADVVVDEETEVAGDDFIRVAVSDGDPEEVLQGAFRAGAWETSGHAEPVFGRDRRGRERSDMEEDNDGRGSLEFLQEMDEDQGCSVWTTGFIEEDTNASESAD